MKLITYLTLFVSVWDNLNDTTFKQGGATQHYELIVLQDEGSSRFRTRNKRCSRQRSNRLSL